EFVTVYRMHPLIPDKYDFVSLGGLSPWHCSFDDMHGFMKSRLMIKNVGASSALYSLGIAHPGEVTLHNSPQFMRRFTRTGNLVDLHAVDLLRARERGVPRYNEFRRLLRLPPAESFDDISGGDPATAQKMREVYSGDIEK